MEHEKGRVKRGLYVCELTGIKINADLNAARNIAKKAGYKTPTPRKILTYIVTTNGIKPITPKEGVTPETPGLNPAQQSEEGVIQWVMPKYQPELKGSILKHGYVSEETNRIFNGK